MKAESRKLENGDLQVVLTFDSHDQICLEHDLLDIVDWFSKGPSAEKIHSCRKRMINENKDLLMKDPSLLSKPMSEVNAILEDPIKCVECIKKLPSYRNRAQREAQK